MYKVRNHLIVDVLNISPISTDLPIEYVREGNNKNLNFTNVFGDQNKKYLNITMRLQS